LRLQPLERGQGFNFANETVGDVVAKDYIGSVERGVRDAAKSGVLNGGEVVDCRVALCGGAYYDVDSNDQTFCQAAQGTFWKAMKNADSKLPLST
jgi:elongation factor G